MKKIIVMWAFFLVVFSAVSWASDASKTKKPIMLHSSVIIQVQITIDRPASAVWPHLMQRDWIADYNYKTVAGEPGKVGHIRALYSPKEEQTDTPPKALSLLKAVKIVPEKLYYAENVPAAYGDSVITGFNVYSLIEKDGKTTVTYTGGKESSTTSQNTYEATEKSFKDASLIVEKRWTEQYLPRLKALVEQIPAEKPHH